MERWTEASDGTTIKPYDRRTNKTRISPIIVEQANTRTEFERNTATWTCALRYTHMIYIRTFRFDIGQFIFANASYICLLWS